MLITTAEITAFIGSFMWPFMRIGAMFLAAPIYGTRIVPTRIKLVLAVSVTIIVMPLLAEMPVVEPLSIDGLRVAVQQIMIGAATGFILQMVFAALIIAGESIAMAMGLGFASMVDPTNGVTVPVISQFFVITGILIFLSLGGHLTLIQIVIDSFTTLPVSTLGIPREGLWTLVNWGSAMFVGALLIALPAVASLLVVLLALGVTTRAAPQLNIFSVGFALTLLMGFIIIMLIMPTLVPRFTELMFAGFTLSRTITGG